MPIGNAKKTLPPPSQRSFPIVFENMELTSFTSLKFHKKRF